MQNKHRKPGEGVPAPSSYQKEIAMKQFGNLAVVCAPRRDIIMTTQDGMVFVRQRSSGKLLSAPWNDDDRVSKIVHELNFGSFAEQRNA